LRPKLRAGLLAFLLVLSGFAGLGAALVPAATVPSPASHVLPFETPYASGFSWSTCHTTTTCTTGAVTVTTGGGLLVIVNEASATPTDSSSDTFHSVGSCTDSSSSAVYIYYVSPAGSTSETVSTGASAFAGITAISLPKEYDLPYAFLGACAKYENSAAVKANFTAEEKTDFVAAGYTGEYTGTVPALTTTDGQITLSAANNGASRDGGSAFREANVTTASSINLSVSNSPEDSADIAVDVPLFNTSLSASPTTTQVGESSTLSYTLTGGTATRTWTLTKNGSSSNLTGASGGTYTFTPLHAGTYTFYFNATDGNSVVSRSTATVVVKAALAATLTAAAATTQVGATDNLALVFAQGVAPYTWMLARNGSSSNLTGATINSAHGANYSAMFAHAASYTFYLNATDAVGSSSKVTAAVTVNAALVATLTATPSTTQVGEPSTLALVMTKGVTPYTWTLARNGSSSNLTGAVINSVHGANYTASFAHAATYTFYLNVTDHVGSTSKVTAAVVVKAALAATLSASPSTTQVGEPSNLALVMANGVAPYTWTLARNGSSSNLTGAVINSAHGANYTASFAHAATYTFYLNVTDAVGSTSKATATVVVKAALAASLNAQPPINDLGETTVISFSYSGGVTPITWTLTVNGSASNITGVIDHYYYSFTPAHVGSYTFYFNSTDAVGSTADKTVVAVFNPALASHLSATPSTTQVGETSVLHYSFTGGVPPINWTLAVGGCNCNVTGASGGSFTFTPHYAAVFTFYLNATDHVGVVSNVTTTVTVNAALSASLVSHPPDISLGQSSRLNYTLSGGVAPITWTLKRNGSALNLTGADHGNYEFTPSHLGVYTFYFNATDSVGSVSKGVTTVNVSALTTPTFLEAVAVNTTAVVLTWTLANFSASNYSVSYGTTYGTYATTISVGVVAHYTVTGLSVNTTYFFIVRDWLGLIESNASNVAPAHTLPKSPASTPQLILSVSFVNTTAVTLVWGAINLSASNYSVSYGTTYGTYSTTISVGVVAHYTVSGLAVNTTYFFIVKEWVGVTAVLASNVAPSHTLPKGSSSSSQLILAVSFVNTTAVTLVWGAINFSAANYSVSYGTVYGAYTMTVSAGLTAHLTITGLSVNTTYFFIVQEWLGVVPVLTSNVAPAHTLPLTSNAAPAAPTNYWDLGFLDFLITLLLTLVVIAYSAHRANRWDLYLQAILRRQPPRPPGPPAGALITTGRLVWPSSRAYSPASPYRPRQRT
jgi:large repetitive protein